MDDLDLAVSYVSGRVFNIRSCVQHVAPGSQITTHVARRLGLHGAALAEFQRDAPSATSEIAEFLSEGESPEEGDEFFKTMRGLLLLQLEYGNGFYRRQVLRSLRGVKPAVHQMTPTLKRFLVHSDSETRRLAAELIGVASQPASTVGHRCRRLGRGRIRRLFQR